MLLPFLNIIVSKAGRILKNLADFPQQQGSHSSHASHELSTYTICLANRSPRWLGRWVDSLWGKYIYIYSYPSHKRMNCDWLLSLFSLPAIKIRQETKGEVSWETSWNCTSWKNTHTSLGKAFLSHPFLLLNAALWRLCIWSCSTHGVAQDGRREGQTESGSLITSLGLLLQPSC